LWKRDAKVRWPFVTLPETADTLEAIVLNHARATFLSRPLTGSLPGPNALSIFITNSYFRGWTLTNIATIVQQEGGLLLAIIFDAGLLDEQEESSREFKISTSALNASRSSQTLSDQGTENR